MNYPTRISVALGVASCLVTGFIAATPRVLGAIDLGRVVVPEPALIQLDLRDLQPLPPEPGPQPEPPKRLIDAGAPAEAPVRETDLISSQDSQAQDMSDAQGNEARPAADEIDEFDQIGSAPSVAAPPPAPQSPPPAPAEPAPAEEPAPAAAVAELLGDPAPVETPQPEPETPPAPEVAPTETPVTQAATGSGQPADAPPAESKPAASPPERFQVAAAQPQAVQPQPPAAPAAPPAAPIPVQELRANKGREGGGATNSGFTSFEANKHALGEYMLKVRSAVEREWRTALHLRYSGVSRTDATIRCSIRPDGTLEFVTITDAGSSLTYAVLCREAIEKAGPFEPFPFDVPEIYLNQNLEINWKFSYM